MSKNIQLTLTDFQYETLLKKAGSFSIQQYLIKKEFPNHEFSHWFNEITGLIEKLPPGTNFSLKTLLSVNWETIPKGVRLSIGKQFLKEVNEGSIRAVKYVKKDSANTTIYKKTL